MASQRPPGNKPADQQTPSPPPIRPPPSTQPIQTQTKQPTVLLRGTADRHRPGSSGPASRMAKPLADDRLTGNSFYSAPPIRCASKPKPKPKQRLRFSRSPPPAPASPGPRPRRHRTIVFDRRGRVWALCVRFVSAQPGRPLRPWSPGPGRGGLCMTAASGSLRCVSSSRYQGCVTLFGSRTEDGLPPTQVVHLKRARGIGIDQVVRVLWPGGEALFSGCGNNHKTGWNRSDGRRRGLSSPYRAACNQVLPHARQIADPFHVVRLANDRLDQVRRRTQQETLGHRGRKGDPLYQIRRLLTLASERLDTGGEARRTRRCRPLLHGNWLPTAGTSPARRRSTSSAGPSPAGAAQITNWHHAGKPNRKLPPSLPLKSEEPRNRHHLDCGQAPS